MNYSLVVMESAKMMKMPTGEGFPLRQGAETGLDCLLVATEACGGRTPDLGFFLEVSVFIGIFGIGFTSRGVSGLSTRQGARPGGWARPPPSWAAQDSSGPSPILRGLPLVQK